MPAVDLASRVGNAAVHPAYFDVRFQIDGMPADWPAQFVIVSAFATTGQQWTSAENDAADRRLMEWLAARQLELTRITGYSPITGHAEPSWAFAMAVEKARDLGRQFKQDAIYLVDGDHLSVTHCRPNSELVGVGLFRERIDIGSLPPRRC